MIFAAISDAFSYWTMSKSRYVTNFPGYNNTIISNLLLYIIQKETITTKIAVKIDRWAGEGARPVK